MPSSACDWRSTLFPYTTLFRSDRKSTRLNSSHDQISYAVFCLNKKNYCHAVTRPMMSQRAGSIVNLSSVASEFGNRGQVNYAASKGGIDALTRCLAKELSPRKI